MQWTDEQRKAIAMAYYTDGESASAIAARYGVSRNAIIGLAHRVRARSGGLTRKLAYAVAPQQPKQARAAKADRPRKQSPRTWHMQACALAKARPVPAEPVSPPQPLAAARSIPQSLLGADECKFPVTPHDAPRAAHLFCGLPAEGGPYCPHHAEIAYRRQPSDAI